jgi:hypothetical protein
VDTVDKTDSADRVRLVVTTASIVRTIPPSELRPTFFEQALAVAPGDYAAQFELGMIAQRQGQFKEGLQRFETACKAAPEASECGQPLQALRERAK